MTTDRRTERQRELADFLRAMRARLRPADVGLPDVGRRRTPGLRRQEVAQLAAVSIDWYIRLEQGRVGAPGSAVLDGIAVALALSAAERDHLHLIARGEVPPPTTASATVSPSLRALLDGMPVHPAYVIDRRFDILAVNDAASAVFGTGFGHGAADNLARLLLLDASMRATQLDWARIARETVGNLRANLGRHRDDARLREVIAELRAGSPDFAAWWSDHTVREKSHGTKRILHPDAGELTVCYDTLAALDGSDQRLVVVTPRDPATDAGLRALVAAHSRARAATPLRAVAG